MTTNAVVRNALERAGKTVAKNERVNKEFGEVSIVVFDNGDIRCSMGGFDANPYGKKDEFIEKAKRYISTLKNKAANLEKAIAYIKTR